MAGPARQTRENLAKRGKAMPDGGTGSGGRFPIRDREDLRKAIQAVGRAGGGEEGRAKVRRFIIKRARELNLTSLVPSNWAANGSVKA